MHGTIGSFIRANVTTKLLNLGKQACPLHARMKDKREDQIYFHSNATCPVNSKSSNSCKGACAINKTRPQPLRRDVFEAATATRMHIYYYYTQTNTCKRHAGYAHCIFMHTWINTMHMRTPLSAVSPSAWSASGVSTTFCAVV